MRLKMSGTMRLAALLLTAGIVHAADSDADRTRAATAVDALAAQLKSVLVATLSSAGPVAAIKVCADQAPAIAAEVSGTHGFAVGRVTDRARNPDNAANAWQSKVLQDWAAQQAAGADLAVIEFFERTPEGGFRYMKPIIVQPVCLSCHGDAPSPAVQSALAGSYATDRATGYSAGDLRGAFVAVQ